MAAFCNASCCWLPLLPPEHAKFQIRIQAGTARNRIHLLRTALTSSKCHMPSDSGPCEPFRFDSKRNRRISTAQVVSLFRRFETRRPRNEREEESATAYARGKFWNRERYHTGTVNWMTGRIGRRPLLRTLRSGSRLQKWRARTL